ncbi:MAG: ATP-binding cassette domain-containing protein, partial [Anaerolineales bacterium]|nr:ATP-binding cassette domain-containing protein [Anaerolineales bacterium]
MPDTPIVLQATGISKRFPGVLANDDVSFDLRQGEVHALLGENGAGKTTLMNILYGLYKPDAGEVLVNGNLMVVNSTRDAISHGIGMVHQHFMLIPVFSVTENIMLGSETDHRSRGSGPVPPLDRLERKTVADMVRELSHKYSLDVDPEAIVGDLPVGV